MPGSPQLPLDKRTPPPTGEGGPLLSRLRVRRGREIIGLATPTVLTMLSHTLMWTVDTALLGHVSSVALASAGLGGILTWAGYSLFNNMSRITSTFVSQAHGRNDDRAVRIYTWQGIYLSIAAGLVLQAFGYYSYLAFPYTQNPAEIQHFTYVYVKWRTLSAVSTQLTFCLMGFFQGRRDVKTPMWAGIAGNLVNVVLDIWLIFGWSGIEIEGRTFLAMEPLGVKGAAIATSIGATVNVGILVVCLVAPREHRERYRIHLPRIPDARVMRDIVVVGMPAAWEAFVEMTAFAMFSVFVGRLGAVSLAASQITIQLLSFSFMPMWGLTVAGTVLIGNAIGARDPDHAEMMGYQVYKVGFYYTLTLGVLLVIGGRWLYGIFSDDPEVLVLAAVMATTAAFFQFGDGLRMVTLGLLSGAGDTRYPMLVSVILNWGLYIPLIYFLVVRFGGNVIQAWMVGVVIYALQAAVLFARFRSGKWRAIRIFSQ
jgi:putative MATE family efflux protein